MCFCVVSVLFLFFLFLFFVFVFFLSCFFFLMIRRPPRSTLDRSSAASDVYKRQHLLRAPATDLGVSQIHAQEVGGEEGGLGATGPGPHLQEDVTLIVGVRWDQQTLQFLSLIHISEPTRPY